MSARHLHGSLRSLALATIVALWAIVGTLAAGASEEASLRITDPDVSEHPEVSVTVSVPRSLVGPDPSPRQFRVEEAGEERQILAVEPSVTEGFEIVLLLDTSGSMAGEAMEATKRAARAFLEAMPHGVRVAVVGFASQPYVVTEFSDDLGASAQAIDGLEARGETALYDGVVAAASLFANDAQGQRAIVLLSDGGDTVSGARIEEAHQQVTAAEASLYAVQLHTEESNTAPLSNLAAAGDGEVVEASDPAALTAAYERIAGRLLDRVIVTYRSEAAGPVTVRVSIGGADGQQVGQQVGGELLVQLPSAPATPSDPAAQPQEQPAPQRPGTLVAPGWTESRWLLAGGGAATFVGVAMLLLLVLGPGKRGRLRGVSDWAMGAGAGRAQERGLLSDLAERATGLAERGLESTGKRSGLAAALERAGVSLRVGEFIVLAACAVVVAVAAGLTVGGWVLASVAALLALVAPAALLRVLIRRRQTRFHEQLPDILQLLAGSLKTGYGIMQSIDAVAREADAPSSVEFRRIVLETRLGRDLGQALHATAERMENEDFEWVVQAIEINREVGGDLAEVLETVAETIREREQVRRQIKALSAEGRLSAVVLIILPLAVAGFIWMTNPDYLLELVRGGPIGYVMVGMGALFMVAGALWMKSIVKLVY